MLSWPSRRAPRRSAFYNVVISNQPGATQAWTRSIIMSEDHTPLTTMSKNRALFDQLGKSLAAFQSSTDAFRVLYTLPWTSQRHNTNSSENAAAATTQPRQQPNRLVILDSSFNPPTRAHGAMLRSVLGSLGSSRPKEGSSIRILLLLAVRNADKAPQPAAFPSRLGLMAKFGEELGEWEEGRDVQVDIGVTTEPYFHDKLLAIQQSGSYSGASPAVEHVFLAGFDTLIRVFDPKYYAGGMRAALDPFFESARLRVTLRGDDNWGTVEEQRAWVKGLEDGGLEERGGRREWLQMIELVDGVEGEAVSSSRVREAVRLGNGVEGMVCEEVRRLIEDEGLYRAQ